MADLEHGKITVSVLACMKCGAPMYPDMQKGGMSCAYCGHLVPFAHTGEDFEPRMTYRHQPIEIIDGCLKLGHVAIMGKDALKPPPPVERRIRRTRLDEKIREYDEQAFDAMNDEAYFEMNCPHCGKKLSSKLTDNIFTCPYCGQKFGDFDRLSTGDFDANLIVGRKLNFYGKCLPFHLSREDAAQAVGSLKRRYPQDFAGDDIEARAKEEMVAAYVPVQLADFRWKMQVKSERGTFWFYQECLNWAWPRTLMFDAYLLDETAPWDYDELSIIKPRTWKEMCGSSLRRISATGSGRSRTSSCSGRRLPGSGRLSASNNASFCNAPAISASTNSRSSCCQSIISTAKRARGKRTGRPA